MALPGEARTRRHRECGNLKSVLIGELHVEEHHRRSQTLDLCQRGPSVRGLAHNVEAVVLEQRPGATPEGREVVNDEHGHSHAAHRRMGEAAAREG